MLFQELKRDKKKEVNSLLRGNSRSKLLEMPEMDDLEYKKSDLYIHLKFEFDNLSLKLNLSYTHIKYIVFVNRIK